MDTFLSLRLALDDAITYGSIEQAMRLAEQGLQKAREAHQPGEESYFKGQIALLRDDFIEAMRHFDAVIEQNPKDGAAYNDRALCMVELGTLDAAFYYFDRGIEAEPDYATIYHNKGWLLNNLGRFTEAIGCFKKALELDPQRAVTYENLAEACLNLGRSNDALQAYQQALSSIKPEYVDIRAQLSARINQLKKSNLRSYD